MYSRACGPQALASVAQQPSRLLVLAQPNENYGISSNTNINKNRRPQPSSWVQDWETGAAPQSGQEAHQASHQRASPGPASSVNQPLRSDFPHQPPAGSRRPAPKAQQSSGKGSTAQRVGVKRTLASTSKPILPAVATLSDLLAVPGESTECPCST